MSKTATTQTTKPQPQPKLTTQPSAELMSALIKQMEKEQVEWDFSEYFEPLESQIKSLRLEVTKLKEIVAKLNNAKVSQVKPRRIAEAVTA